MFANRANRWIAVALISSYGVQMAPAVAQNSAQPLAQTLAQTSAEVPARSSAPNNTQNIAQSAVPSAETAAAESTALISGARNITLNLMQLGAWGQIKLKGGQGTRTLSFGVRADEKVIAAKLTVAYDYSPSLIESISYIKVSLNDKIAILESLPKERAIASRRELALDPSLFKDSNELRLDFEGNISVSCSNPLQTSIWLNVNEPTKLELTVVPKSLVSDLKTLPAPFLDKADGTLSLPMVFAANPSVGSLKAAGIVASWFGIEAGAKSARFVSFINELPAGNAVIFVTGAEEIAGFKSASNSSLSIQTHPSNPAAKLLVVTGSTDVEILSAARTLALWHKTLTGPSFKVIKEVPAAKRKPYDAPAWIRTDRPVKFGELAKLQDLKTQGYSPEVIRVNYRVPPDVFAWRTNGAPMQLKYRATRLPEHKNSALGLSINNNFIDTIALNVPADKATKSKVTSDPLETANNSLRELATFVPAYGVSSRDQLQFAYTADVTQTSPCDLPPNNFVASIDAESSIDFSTFPKYAALPNLAYFAQLGFPFTRLADLSETSVVLPNTPSRDEINVYLTVMAKLGESTGYPTINHTLLRVNDISSAADTDLIVIGSGKSQNLLSNWSSFVPIAVENGVRTIKEPVAGWRPAFGWEQPESNSLTKAPSLVNISGSGTLVAMMGFESPLTPNRSVVFFYADRASDLSRIEDALVDPARTSSMVGDFVIFGDKTLQATKASNNYFVGELAVSSKIRWLLADHPILVAVAILILAILFAALLYRPLLLLKRRFAKMNNESGTGTGH